MINQQEQPKYLCLNLRKFSFRDGQYPVGCLILKQTIVDLYNLELLAASIKACIHKTSIVIPLLIRRKSSSTDAAKYFSLKDRHKI